MRHTADVMTGLAHVVRLVTPSAGVLVLTTPVYPPFLDLGEITGRAVRHVRLAETGRLGAAIVSHATLNGSAVLLLVLVTALG